MAKQVPIRDSNGQYSHRKRAWVKRHEAAGHGEWKNGVFEFHRQEVAPPVSVYGAPGSRAVSLIDRMWDQGADTREFPVDSSYWDGRSMRFWRDQSSSHGKIVVAGR